MHSTCLYSTEYNANLSHGKWWSSYARLDLYIQQRIAASPGSGTVFSIVVAVVEAEVGPMGCVHAVSNVESKEWVVKRTMGLPTHQGRLCRRMCLLIESKCP
jgi:hypothetical protein